jgi:hypothetical protein
MASLAPVLDMSPEDLAERITDSLQRLIKLKRDLPNTASSRLSIRVHRAIPLGSAIFLDHETPEGRIQIETKVYKAPFDKSFAFEIIPAGTSGLFSTIIKGYSDLIRDGAEYA